MSSRSEQEILLEQECDRLQSELDRHVRIYELALQNQANELATAKAAMLALQDAFDAQPWATDEPVRVQLDRVTAELERWRRGGVTEAMLRQHDGTILVGEGCEIALAGTTGRQAQLHKALDDLHVVCECASDPVVADWYRTNTFAKEARERAITVLNAEVRHG